MIATPTPVSGSPAWLSAARLIARWLDQRERIDALLDSLPRSLAPTERARCQHLVLGVVRHFGRLEAALGRLVAHPPRFPTRAALFLMGYELLESHRTPGGELDPGRTAKIVHHAVEQTKLLASPAEARLVNAVGRKLAAALARPAPASDAPAAELAEYFSHPVWLVNSWLAQFGPESTRRLLEWNQRPAPVHARWRGARSVSLPPLSDRDQPAEPAATGPSGETNALPPSAEATAAAGNTGPTGTPPDFLKPTRWPGFFEVEPGHWPDVEPLLRSGQIYLQDPSTRLPVELLAPSRNETVLDLCAAPGGKSLLIADRMQSGRLVAVDLPGTRIDRLKENLSRAGAIEVALVQADALHDLGGALREHRLPERFDAILLDAPCSNTGVIRHRVDVKWRLQPGDFKKHPRQQLSLLHNACRLVGNNGRIVYSTCSIDAEENEHVVRAFLASKAGGGFELVDTVLSHPWNDGHDGGASFLLRRRS